MKFIVSLALACASASCAAPPDWTLGAVVTVDPQRSQVILKHERIKSIDMDAMTMPFKADPKVDLTPFKAGDKVRFTVSNKDDYLLINAMEKAQ